MKLSRIAQLLLPMSLLFATACGGKNTLTQSTVPPPPTSSDPWFGTAGNVLVSDRNNNSDGKLDFLWIGFNSQTEWQIFMANTKLAIGGTMVSPSTNGLNFHVDPNTTETAEQAVPELFTTIDGLKANPTATNQSDHTHRWLLHVTVEQIK